MLPCSPGLKTLVCFTSSTRHMQDYIGTEGKPQIIIPRWERGVIRHEQAAQAQECQHQRYQGLERPPVAWCPGHASIETMQKICDVGSYHRRGLGTCPMRRRVDPVLEEVHIPILE